MPLGMIFFGSGGFQPTVFFNELERIFKHQIINPIKIT
jgi:hypothetical protein